MDLEAPLDGWYVWLGVMLVSIALAGIVLSFPTQTPPDATEAVNTVDAVAADPYGATATYEHRADEVRVGTTQIELRNDAGTDRAAIRYGSIVPITQLYVDDHEENRTVLLRLLEGENPETVIAEHAGIDSEDDLLIIAEETKSRSDEDDSEWTHSDGMLSVRSVPLAGEMVVLVYA